MAHTFDPDMADRLEDVSRFRYLSRDELVALLDPAPEDRIVDLGSGTGFYTRELAPYGGRFVGVDLQPAMHELFARYGRPASVGLVTAAIGTLPFADGVFDAAVSTMTFHEFAAPSTVAEVARVLTPGGRFVAADWSAAGEGAAGPPLGERRDASDAAELLTGAGFELEAATDRPETFVAVGLAP